ncbi:hypothetical protein NPIL_375561 [Nephila pilipes]|uniref:Uncharacterized protein n=1 Tax=Nephila pilipes TaxID=299642 RepID=A0A8X6T6N6_NEPPI|nr:hypothetical protein NPIL_375561 [Nephila pilipes]
MYVGLGAVRPFEVPFPPPERHFHHSGGGEAKILKHELASSGDRFLQLLSPPPLLPSSSSSADAGDHRLTTGMTRDGSAWRDCLQIEERSKPSHREWASDLIKIICIKRLVNAYKYLSFQI